MNDEQVLQAIELDDSYRVLSVLAHGAGGTTELVMRGNEGPFVRKRIPLGLANRGAWEAAARVRHPRVPRVVSIYELPDELVCVCEYVPGESLEQRVRRAGPLGQAEAVQVAADVCDAASALHAQGVVHRDITPKNVILAADGAHLIDLGIARTKLAGASSDTTHLGTHPYAAPEQYGFAQSDERSDVYAVGQLLHFMLMGAPANEVPADQRVPAWLADVIRRATAFEPSARFSSADELAAALGGADVVSTSLETGQHLTAQAAGRRRRAGFIRKYLEASYLRKVAAASVIALFAIMVADAIQTIVGRWPSIDPASRIEDMSFAMLNVAFLIVCAHQVASAIVGAWPYEHEEHIIRRLVINCFVALLAMSLLVVAITRLT